ncbi:hypothetical protein [Bartonella sp. CB169]|uniref:hypothetical protein n=1 Tax=Bartonella sp. CB169 TaxID=3112257 RepID=UPI00300DC5B1
MSLDSPGREKHCEKCVLLNHDIWIENGTVIFANAIIMKDILLYVVIHSVFSKKLKMRFPDNVI